MKKLKMIFFLLLISGLVIGTQACSDDESDDPTPTCTDGVQNGNETGVDCGGDCAPCPTCDDGIQNGNETGVDCGGDCDPCLVGIQGEWQSSGANVAPLLVTLFAVDSIYAEFKTDMTYSVTQVDTSGTAIQLTGTYAQTESSVDGIWEITVNQSAPATLTSEGIFEINDNTMKYEIVQTQPDLGATPPTPEAGFGSSSGGALGDTNVQTYIRIE